VSKKATTAHEPRMYGWRSNRRHINASPQFVGEAIEAIASERGCCPPGALVELARPEDSPLHGAFTWDDKVAAERWRVDEARSIISSICVVEDAEDESGAPAFVSSVAVTDEGVSEGYRPVWAMPDDASEDAARRAVGLLLGVKRRVGALKGLLPVWRALDKVMRDMGMENG
jgi:hypothetical protein